MLTDTAQMEWNLLNQASANVAAGLTANVNTLALSYPTAVTKAARPAQTYLKRIPQGSGLSSIRLRVLLKHASAVDGKKAQVKVWLWDGMSGALCVCDLTATAGTGVFTSADLNIEGLTLGATGQWAYADTLVETATPGLPLIYNGVEAVNGIHECEFYAKGSLYLFADFKCNIDGSNTSSDAAVLWKGY